MTPHRAPGFLGKEFGPTYNNNCGTRSEQYRHSIGLGIFLTIITGGAYIPYVLLMKILCQ